MRIPMPAEKPSGIIRNANYIIEERKTYPNVQAEPYKFINTKKPQE